MTPGGATSMLESIWAWVGDSVPLLATIATVLVGLSGLHWWLIGRRADLGSEARLPRQLLLALLTVVGLVVVLLMLPISDTTRGQVLSFLGVVLTGVIGLSSTTFVANAMAGVMLRTVGQFRPGDFVRLNDQFGRVTERGLFHIEIQTEDRDLTTFPNLLMITNPVTVVHREGTIVSATVSLGYDVPRTEIEDALLAGAEAAGLADPFVQVLALGDFSVTYRIAGSLDEVKHLLTARSNLRKAIMDALHAADIEIVSPTFMNQRRQAADARMIPTTHVVESPDTAEAAPEERIFDKADEAEKLQAARERLAALDEGSDQRQAVEADIAAMEERIAASKAGNT